MKPSRSNRHSSIRHSMLALSLPVVLVAAGCGGSDDTPAAAADEMEVTTSTIPSSVGGDDGSAFCDAVFQFDATNSPGGPSEPSAADMTEFAETDQTDGRLDDRRRTG